MRICERARPRRSAPGVRRACRWVEDQLDCWTVEAVYELTGVRTCGRRSGGAPSHPVAPRQWRPGFGRSLACARFVGHSVEGEEPDYEDDQREQREAECYSGGGRSCPEPAA